MAGPTVQQLRYAVAVAEARHFGRAARTCVVSQPALSAQVRELEARLGVQLFERTSRGVLVTPAGVDVLERARRILRELDDLREAAAGGGDDLVGPLRLGVIPTIAPYVLPPAIRLVADAHPNVELYLREDRTETLIAQLQAGSLDLLLLALPLGRPGIEELALYDEPFLLAVPETHPLAQRRRCDVSALADERLVLLEEGHCLRDQALAVCEPAGHDGHVEVQGTSLPTVVQMVGAGLGVTLLPAATISRDVHDGENVVVRELRSPTPTRTVGLAWRSSSARGPLYRQLGELVAVAGRQAMRR
ncbi:MAG: LysR family transcriptional regulator [Acidimicrobiia bacterium]|nr:LysR family transcriptional regulator [Acidimicrobiia bacterium]